MCVETYGILRKRPAWRAWLRDTVPRSAEQLNHLPIERWDVVGLEDRHKLVIDYDLAIDPLRARVA